MNDTQTFEPKNELENRLVAVMADELEAEDFMRELLDAQVFMPVQDEPDSGIKGFQRTTKATPLVVGDDDGSIMMVLFSSPERAREFLAGHPGYGGGLLVDFTWVLERMEPGVSIVLNPGLEAGFDMAPETVVEMLELMAARKKAN